MAQLAKRLLSKHKDLSSSLKTHEKKQGMESSEKLCVLVCKQSSKITESCAPVKNPDSKSKVKHA